MTDTNAADPMAAINAQIEAARQAGAAAVPNSNVPAVGVGNQNLPAVNQVQQGRPVSLGELLAQGGLRVDAYLKVKEAGFLIGTDTLNYIEEIPVEFRLSDVVPFFSVRWGAQPAQYRKSFDRMVESKSKKPWSQVIAEAQAADPRCRGDYPSAEIPFVVCETIKGTKGDTKGKALIETGQSVGLTLSVTNFKDFAAFIKPYNDLVEVGQLPRDLLLRGKLVHAQRRNATDTWGAATFVDFAAISNDDATQPADPGAGGDEG